VLGMHRSGTSALTRVVDLLGMPVTGPEGLLRADARNPAGYWEARRLVMFNERLLFAMGGSWCGPPPLTTLAGADRALAGHTDDARALFRAEHPGPRWAWKDPRNCLTLRFWRAVIDDPAVAVIAYREPGEVMDSLHQRGGFSRPLALALWERYLRAAALLSHGLSSLVVDYGGLVADPPGTARRVGAFLEAHGLGGPPGAAAAAAASVSAELHRNRSAPGEGVALSPSQQQLAEALRDAAARGVGVDGLELGVETAATEYALGQMRRGLAALDRG